MIAQLRREAQELRNRAEELTAQAARMIVQAQEKEREADRLEANEARNNLIEVITNAVAEMSLHDLRRINSHFVEESGNIVFEDEPQGPIWFAPQEHVEEVHEVQEVQESSETEQTPAPTIEPIDAENVTLDMVTEEMMNADLTLVGVKYQDLWREHRRVPAIGDRVTLAKRNNVSTQNTVGYTSDNISLGILPASAEKFEQLNRLNLSSLNNREVDLEHPALSKEYEVAAVIPGAFIFLNEVAGDNVEEVAEVDASAAETTNMNMSIDVLEGVARSIGEARRLFEAQKPNFCSISDIIERENDFLINYVNHRCNSDDFRRCTTVNKGE